MIVCTPCFLIPPSSISAFIPFSYNLGFVYQGRHAKSFWEWFISLDNVVLHLHWHSTILFYDRIKCHCVDIPQSCWEDSLRTGPARQMLWQRQSEKVGGDRRECFCPGGRRSLYFHIYWLSGGDPKLAFLSLASKKKSQFTCDLSLALLLPGPSLICSPSHPYPLSTEDVHLFTTAWCPPPRPRSSETQNTAGLQNRSCKNGVREQKPASSQRVKCHVPVWMSVWVQSPSTKYVWQAYLYSQHLGGRDGKSPEQAC